MRNHLERFQAFLDPLTGSVRLEAYWVKVADNGDSPPLVGPLEQGVSRSYPSVIAANEAALNFPAFPEIALRFQTEPFTAMIDLLDALRQLQAWEESTAAAAAAATDTQDPPFEGAP